MELHYGFASGFATLTNCEYDLYTLYKRIPVHKVIVQKKICINGFKRIVAKVPADKEYPLDFDRTKISFLEIKTKNKIVIGIYNSNKIKITGNITSKFEPGDCEKYCRWFVDKVLKLKYTSFHFAINNITASFRMGYSIPFRNIRAIFSEEFKDINLADQETAPYNITRMYKVNASDALMAAVVHTTGYFQIMGAKSTTEVEKLYSTLKCCLHDATFDKGDIKMRAQSKFALAGIKKGRGRPSKKDLEELNALRPTID